MSNKVKTPWYNPILGFINRRVAGRFGSFILTCLVGGKYLFRRCLCVWFIQSCKSSR